METPTVLDSNGPATSKNVGPNQQEPNKATKPRRTHKLLLICLLVIVVMAVIIGLMHSSKKPAQSISKSSTTVTVSSGPTAKNAFEELQLLPYYNLQAQNNFQIPKGGIEYVSDIYSTIYTYPWLGTVTAIDSNSVTINKQYTMGDKVQHSSSTNEPLIIPLDAFNAYTKKTAMPQKAVIVGQIFAVWPQKLLKHHAGDKVAPTEVTEYFAFTVDHSVSDIANSDPANPQATSPGDYSKDSVSVPSSLGLSNRCINNAADTCSFQIAQGSPGTGLYPLNNAQGGVTDVAPMQTAKTAASNPSSIPFGEGVPDGQSQPKDLLQRNVQGTVISVTDSTVVIKTSSGSQWTLAYSAAQRQRFTKLTGKDIKTGSVLGGIVLANINELDGRSVDNTHVNEMSLL